MVVLDTDVLSIAQLATGEAFARMHTRLQALPAQQVRVTVISFEEQMRGWLTFVARAKTLEQQVQAYARLYTLLEDFRNRAVLRFDAAASAKYEQLVKAKIRIGTMDLKIAAIALAQDALLLSRNLKDFRKVPGLQVEDWTRPPA
jgi:tRNA(fMet)-specific endonuclease VapC